MSTKCFIFLVLIFGSFNLLSQKNNPDLRKSYQQTKISYSENELNDFISAITINKKSAYKDFSKKHPKSTLNKFVITFISFSNKKYKKEKQNFFKIKTSKIKPRKKYKEGDLIGVKNLGRIDVETYGMVFIPRGSFQMGEKTEGKKNITVSVDPFWIDQTEVTNLQYREFVNWVRDSIALRFCVQNGLEEFKADVNIEEIDTEYYDHSDSETCYLNWDKKDELWNSENEEVRDALSELYFPNQERFYRQKNIDTRKLVYEYYFINFDKLEENNGRASVIEQKKIPIYPDTLVWLKDFSENFNDPIFRYYFWHKAFSFYPIVGVSWEQAKAFCVWKTDMTNQELHKKEIYNYVEFRLPTEAEWEYAARGGHTATKYPWGNENPKNQCNFFSNENSSTYISQTMTFTQNDYGLYDMAGNVAEYTSSKYNESDDKIVVKGGSWSHTEDYLQNGYRAFFHKDSSSAYVGFRCIRSYFEETEDFYQEFN